MSKIDVKKIILGTAQLGKRYGITNFNEKNLKKEAFKILDLALKNNINFFDTASKYNSEKIIGEFISTHKISKNVQVFTKISSFREKKNFKQFVLRSLENSLKNLKCDINTLFLHDTGDINLYKKNIDFFLDLKKIFPIKKIGFSVYSPSEIKKTSGLGCESVYQFPVNIVDHRFLDVKLKKKQWVGRSVFLQGILLGQKLKRTNVPVELIEAHKKYHHYLNSKEINPLQLLLSFVSDVNKINKFIIGVDNAQQLNEIVNCEIYKLNSLKLIKKLKSFFNGKIIDPRQWN